MLDETSVLEWVSPVGERLSTTAGPQWNRQGQMAEDRRKLKTFLVNSLVRWTLLV